jgi:hypothetical protein
MLKFAPTVPEAMAAWSRASDLPLELLPTTQPIGGDGTAAAYGCIELTDALSCRRSLIGRVSMLTQAISLVLLCLGVVAFVADSARPPMLATAIAAWLVMPDALMHR